MYKYKKTIIINNRRRRIFSKEKSNTEYILYKNEYITLNAYNKKNGGTMIKYITNSNATINRYLSDSYSIKEFHIKQNDIVDYINHNKLPVVTIDTYKFDLSDIISNYLKDKSKINTGNQKKWIITEINDNILKVNGYTSINEWIMENPQQNLIKYGNTIHEQFIELYKNEEMAKKRTEEEKKIKEITIQKFPNLSLQEIANKVAQEMAKKRTEEEKKIKEMAIQNFPNLSPQEIAMIVAQEMAKKKAEEEEEIKNLYITRILKFPLSQSYLYYYDSTNEIVKKIYDEFKKNYYIYFFQNKKDSLKIENNNENYTIGRYYNFNDILFKCINIIIKIDKSSGFEFTKYDIYFKYIGNEIEKNKEITEDNSRVQLIKYGQVKHLEMFEFYNRTSDRVSIIDYNSTIQGITTIKVTDDTKFLHYYDGANDVGNEEYYKLKREGYFIYSSIEYTNKFIIDDKVDTEYDINNVTFKCINIITKKHGIKELSQIFKKFVTNKINEFEIPSKFIDKSSIYVDSKKISDYLKSIGKKISDYLKSIGKINIDFYQNWIITEYNNPFMIVSGYTNDELGNIVNEINTEDALIKYGNQNHEVMAHEYTDNYTDNSTLANDDKIQMYISDTLSNTKIKTYLFYNYLANKKGKDIYMKLKTDYFIYLTIFKNTNTDYKVGNQYYLLDTNFTCTKIIELTNRITGDTEYLIVFRFDGDDVKAPKQGIEEPLRDPLDEVLFGGNNKYKKTDKEITVIYKKKEYKRVIYICERKKYVKINKTFMLLSKLKKV